MSTAKKKALLHLVAQQALLNASTLKPAERADLFEGISLLLPGSVQGEAAASTAFYIREAETAQLHLFAQFAPAA